MFLPLPFQLEHPRGERQVNRFIGCDNNIEVMFKELKSGLHWGRMQVTKKEERIQRSVALPVMAYVLLLRLYGADLAPEQPASIFALKQRFIEEA